MRRDTGRLPTRGAAALRGWPGDVILAGTLAGASVAAIPSVSPRGPLALAVVVNVVFSGVLAWRRVAPLAVLAIAIGVMTGQSLVVGSVSNSVVQFVSLLVLLFSFGHHSAGRDTAVGLVLCVAGIYIVQFHDPTSTTADRALSPLALTLLPLGAGRLLRREQETAARLRTLTVELERRRDADARAAVLADRARVAREVHDIVAHSVGVMLVQSGAAEAVLDIDPTRSRAALASVREVGHETLVELRHLLTLLGDDDLTATALQQPGLDQLEKLAQQVRTSGLDVTVDVADDVWSLPASPGIQLAAYRLVQEALTNVRKHAQTSRASVSIRYDGDLLRIDVVDDGWGREEEASGGRGLRGMRERVAACSGTFSAGPLAEGGWRVRAALPRAGQ